MKRLSYVNFLFAFFISFNSYSQQFFRIKSDISIKEKVVNTEQSNLTIGTVYYDKTNHQIVYDISFPEKEILVLQDTVIYTIVDNKIKNKLSSPIFINFSIFHLCLNGQLKNYGLKDSFYKIDKVEKEKDMVISTWLPDAKLSSKMGKVVMSNKENKLFGIVFFKPDNTIISKQFFKNYVNIKGLEFPTEVIQITYTENGEKYQVTTYKNIVLDEMGKENRYNFSITGLPVE